jgi:hypothetical protein
MYHQINIQKFYVLPTQCIYVFRVDLSTNSDYFPTQTLYKLSDSTFLSNASRLQKEHYFWKAARLRPFVLLVRATCR